MNLSTFPTELHVDSTYYIKREMSYEIIKIIFHCVWIVNEIAGLDSD